MEGGVRYCTTDDGVRIAYTVEGEGPPLFLVHYIYAFSLAYLVPTYDDVLRRIGEGRTFIRYDMRGTGLSQTDVEDFSWQATQLDIEAVVRAVECDQVTVLGVSIGGARAIEFAASHPDNVAALILYEAFPRIVDVFPKELLESTANLARSNWHYATRSVADTAIRRLDEQEGRGWEDLTEQSTTGAVMGKLIDSQIELDVTNRLAEVQCPTLVCHSRNDPLWPFEHGARLAEGIPGARLVPLDGHEGGPFTNAGSVVEAIDAFLSELAEASSSTGALSEPVVIAKPLTPRETEILRLIAQGMTSREISAKLSLSVRTVGRHITNIYVKIGARGRADATSFALKQGLVKE